MLIRKMLNGTTVTICDGKVQCDHGKLSITFCTRESKIVKQDGIYILTDKDETGGVEIDNVIKHTLTMYHFVKVEGEEIDHCKQ